MARWIVPANLRGKYANWSPGGRQLYLGDDEGSAGLWCFDLGTGKTKKLCSGTVLKGLCSSNGHMALASAYPRGIWIVQAPDMRASQTLEAHNREVIRWATRRIEANYLTEDTRLTRAQAYLELKEIEQARTDLEWLSQHGNNPTTLATRFNEMAWRSVAGSEALRNTDLALWLAQRAINWQPSSPDIRTTTGAVQYRRGQYREALSTLQMSDRDHQIQHPGGIPRDVAFVAMAQHQLGHHAESELSLKRLQKLMATGSYCGDFEGQALLREAREVIGR